MDFGLFLFKNSNFIYIVLGLLFSLLFLKKLRTRSKVLFSIIIGLCTILTISTQYEEWMGNLPMDTEENRAFYNYAGGDLLRKTLSIINYVLRPAILLLFIQITTKSKAVSFLWILVALTVPLYATAYYSNITFNIVDNSWRPGDIFFFRFYSIIISFFFIALFAILGVIKSIKNKTLEVVIRVLTSIFAVIVSILEMKYGGNVLTLTIMIALVFYFVYIYSHVATKQEYELLKMNYTDVLTGLGNERAYYQQIESIDKRKGNDSKRRYAIAVMDLNGLKVTDDTFGHRFGCQLIVQFGHMLPEFFKTSQLFHIGGDEFVAILEGDDFRNRNKLIEQFTEVYGCKELLYEDKKLILSVAIGLQENEKGKKYNEIFQQADKNMYANKVIVKRKYKINSRIMEEE